MNRRELIAGAGAISSNQRISPNQGRGASRRLHSDLLHYVEFGRKNTCGPGERAAGAWIRDRLTAAGYAVSEQRVRAPALTDTNVRIERGGADAEVSVFARFASPTAFSGPARIMSLELLSSEGIAGGIAVVLLPRHRWSSALHPAIQACVRDLRAARARAIILVTHGPSSERLSLNAPLDSDALGLRDGAFTDVPTLILGPDDWRRLLSASGDVRVRVEHPGTEGESFNLIASAGEPTAPAVVISTPRTGWGPCGGERGPGIALFLELAHWLRRHARGRRVIAVNTTAHEFEDAGARVFLERAAPRPDSTELWVHLGAGLAARDWHEAGETLLPLPSADPQRFLLVPRDAIAQARRAFSGVPGLEQPYPIGGDAQGELRGVLGAGFRRVVGAFGAHRRHHAPTDDTRCVDGALAAPVLAGYKALIAEMLR